MRALALAVLVAGACAKAPPPPRAPRGAEVSTETVVVNYGPTRLRVLPDLRTDGRSGARGRYLILATEYPQLFATWRPLGVIDKAPPPGELGRAGDFVWLRERVLEVAIGDGGGRAPAVTKPAEPQIVYYDRDGKKGARAPLKLPTPCIARRPALLQSDGEAAFGVLACGAEALPQALYVLRFSGEATLQRAVALPGGQPADGYLRWAQSGDDEEYVLAGTRLFRLRGGALAGEARLPEPEGDGETRALLADVARDRLLVIDGAAGRLTAIARATLQPGAERRFVVGARSAKVERVRAALVGDKILVVVAERQAAGGVVLTAQRLGDGAGGERVLVASDGRSQPSDHELVPAEGGAYLVWSHNGGTGPLVGLLKLNL